MTEEINPNMDLAAAQILLLWQKTEPQLNRNQKPEPATDPEPQSAKSDQVLEPALTSLMELTPEGTLTPEPKLWSLSRSESQQFFNHLQVSFFFQHQVSFIADAPAQHQD